MPHPLGLITLLTDFGDQDAFVASMKGVILTINPQASFIDLTHHVPPHSVEQAAYLLNSCYRYFPEGTVHVAVVDPGVGSARRPLLVKTASYYFLGPDNGVFSYVLKDDEVEVREIENQQYCLKSVGHTFDGRDLFAPSAAWLTKGVPASSFGQVIHDPMRFSIIEPSRQGNRLVGRIEHVDRFGNLVSNLTLQHLEEVHSSVTKPRELSVRIGEQIIEGLAASYSEGAMGQPSALINSDGRLEIFVREASASDLLKVGKGAPVEVS